MNIAKQIITFSVFLLLSILIIIFDPLISWNNDILKGLFFLSSKLKDSKSLDEINICIVQHDVRSMENINDYFMIDHLPDVLKKPITNLKTIIILEYQWKQNRAAYEQLINISKEYNYNLVFLDSSISELKEFPLPDIIKNLSGKWILKYDNSENNNVLLYNNSNDSIINKINFQKKIHDNSIFKEQKARRFIPLYQDETVWKKLIPVSFKSVLEKNNILNGCEIVIFEKNLDPALLCSSTIDRQYKTQGQFLAHEIINRYNGNSIKPTSPAGYIGGFILLLFSLGLLYYLYIRPPRSIFPYLLWLISPLVAFLYCGLIFFCAGEYVTISKLLSLNFILPLYWFYCWIIQEKKLRTSPEYKEMVMLVTDLRGSTTIAKELPAHEMMNMLKDIFSITESIIHKHKGIIHKITGDGLIAIFGLNSNLSKNGMKKKEIFNAIESSLEIKNELGKYRNKKFKGLGIGIDIGDVCYGMLGDRNYFAEITMIGNAVNNASKLQSAIKNDPYKLIRIFSSKEIKDLAEENRICTFIEQNESSENIEKPFYELEEKK